MKRLLVFSLFALCLSTAANAEEPPEAVKPPQLSGPRAKDVEPPGEEAISASIRRGVDFLLDDQNKDGSWGSARGTKDLNIYAPVPGAHLGFRAAVTALCISALIEVQDDRPEAEQAIERGEAWLFENLPDVRRASTDTMYNVWTHGYSIQTLLRMLKRRPDDAERRQKIAELIESQYDYLSRYESVDGGWGYYDFRSRTQAGRLFAARKAHSTGDRFA
jgi:hypothetical protein